MAWTIEREILYNRDQTLWYCAAEGQPKASSPTPTLTIYRADGSTVFYTTANATAETTDIAVSATSGASQPNRAIVHLASATGLSVDKEFQLYESGIQTTTIIFSRLTATGGGAYDGTLRAPLDLTYSTAAKVRSTWISKAIDSTDVADLTLLENGLRAVWTYDIGTTSYTQEQRYNFVLQDTITPPLTAADILDINPDLLAQAPAGTWGSQLAPVIRASWMQIRQELRAARINLQRVLNLNAFDLVVYHDVIMRLAAEGRIRLRTASPDEYRRYHERRKSAALQAALGALEYTTDPHDEDRPAEQEPRSLPHRVWRA